MTALDFSKLTLGEIATIEKLADMPLTQIQNADAPKGRALAALALIAKRRSGEPTFTWDQAQNLQLDEVHELLSGDESDEATTETPAGGRGKAPRTPRQPKAS